MLRSLVLVLCACPAFSQPVTAIVGATVVDGTGAAPYRANVLIRGDRIESVSPDLSPPPGATVLRADGMTLIPGLFDLHTHLPYSSVGGLTGDWPKILAAYLYCGVTSVVDFGTYVEAFEPMRRLVAAGLVTGPRLSLAARLTTPGGHGAEGGRGDLYSIEVLTPREGRAAIQRVLPYKPEVIKVFTDGWRYGAAPDMTSMREDTLTAVVAEAHANGLPVLTHTVTLDKAKIAARAGVDVIAHGIGNTLVDEELAELMRTKHTTYVPTLAVYEPRDEELLPPLLARLLEPLALSAGAFRQALEVPIATPSASPRGQRWTNLLANTRLLKSAGVPVAAGTDAGVTGTHHGWATLRELQLLVASGVSPLDAITAATRAAAEAIGVADTRGTIAAGKLADLVLVDGAPYRNIAEIERVHTVFLGGHPVDRQRLAALIASKEISPMPVIPARREIANFETDRTSLDTMPINSTDPGHDHSRMLFGRILRGEHGHAMSISGRMAQIDSPFARLNIPLSRAAIEPVDASRFEGIEFEARGEGDYRLTVPTRASRDEIYYAASFRASGKWKRIRIPFAQLQRPNARVPAPWTATDLLMLTFEIARPAGQWIWLELDNVRFY